MLAEKAKRAVDDAKMRQRVEEEVDKMMDNGVRVNPRLVAMLGAGDEGAVSKDRARDEVEGELDRVCGEAVCKHPN